jgi:hypothetical protein
MGAVPDNEELCLSYTTHAATQVVFGFTEGSNEVTNFCSSINSICDLSMSHPAFLLASAQLTGEVVDTFTGHIKASSVTTIEQEDLAEEVIEYQFLKSLSRYSHKVKTSFAPRMKPLTHTVKECMLLFKDAYLPMLVAQELNDLRNQLFGPHSFASPDSSRTGVSPESGSGIRPCPTVSPFENTQIMLATNQALLDKFAEQQQRVFELNESVLRISRELRETTRDSSYTHPAETTTVNYHSFMTEGRPRDISIKGFDFLNPPSDFGASVYSPTDLYGYTRDEKGEKARHADEKSLNHIKAASPFNMKAFDVLMQQDQVIPFVRWFADAYHKTMLTGSRFLLFLVVATTGQLQLGIIAFLSHPIILAAEIDEKIRWWFLTYIDGFVNGPTIRKARENFDNLQRPLDMPLHGWLIMLRNALDNTFAVPQPIERLQGEIIERFRRSLSNPIERLMFEQLDTGVTFTFNSLSDALKRTAPVSIATYQALFNDLPGFNYSGVHSGGQQTTQTHKKRRIHDAFPDDDQIKNHRDCSTGCSFCRQLQHALSQVKRSDACHRCFLCPPSYPKHLTWKCTFAIAYPHLRCPRCGSFKHRNPTECKATIDLECKRCGKAGHKTEMCPDITPADFDRTALNERYEAYFKSRKPRTE